MRMDYSPDDVMMAIAIAVAIISFTAAMVITLRHRKRDLPPDPAVWLLLGFAALALAGTWEAALPSCPRGWWC